MSPDPRACRAAGALYLVVVVTGLFTLAWVPGQLIVRGDAAATLAALRASTPLWRAGIAAFLVMQVAFLLLPLALWRVLRSVHEGAAVAMVTLAVVSVPIGLVSLLGRLEVLALVTAPSASATSTVVPVAEQVSRALAWHGHALLVTSLFWGLWLLPFGHLVLRSGALPRVLGALLILGGVGYVVGVFGDVLVPGYRALPIARWVRLPAAAGEIGTCLWLLFAGARRPAAVPRPAA